MESTTKAAFEEQLGTSFQVRVDAAQDPVDMELVAVRRCSAPETDSDRPFAIELRGPAESPLEQQIFKLEHSQLGSLDLFLVPVGPDSEGMIYEALFN